MTRSCFLAPVLAALVALPCAGGLELASAAPAAAAAQVLQPVVPAATQQQQVLDGFNRERAAAGVPAVTLDPLLETVAQDWADVLGQGDGMRHNPALGTLLSGFPAWGEIVATADTGSPDTHGLLNGDLAVRTWVASPAHRAVLLDPEHTAVGIGLVHTTLWSGGRTVWRSYWVADFGAARRTPPVADGARSYAGVPVEGAILGTYGATGADAGYLGRPAAAEFGPLRAGGFGQHFAGGSIYWSPATGGAVVRGAIRDRWAALGWEGGALGYPLGAEFAVRGGAVQRFQGGLAYWSPATGAQVLSGPVLDAYGATGWENGSLGFPTTSLTRLPGGAFAHFQHGSIYTAAAGTHVVPPAVRDAWAARGWETGPLGYPVSGARTVAGALVQDFQGGTVTVGGGKAVVRTVDLARAARAARG